VPGDPALEFNGISTGRPRRGKAERTGIDVEELRGILSIRLYYSCHQGTRTVRSSTIILGAGRKCDFVMLSAAKHLSSTLAESFFTSRCSVQNDNRHSGRTKSAIRARTQYICIFSGANLTAECSLFNLCPASSRYALPQNCDTLSLNTNSRKDET
jgi:hypothetical protein